MLDGGPLPDAATLAGRLERPPAERPANEQSLVEPLRERVLALHDQGVEGQAIWQLLVEAHGFTGSYSSVKRFLRRVVPPAVRATVRLEVAPGEEAQVDFGFGGQFLDPERGRVRRAWVFVMTLSYSRHQYAELVFDQTLETWVRLHRTAFEFFGGVPRRVILDNLAPLRKVSGRKVVKASAHRLPRLSCSGDQARDGRAKDRCAWIPLSGKRLD